MYNFDLYAVSVIVPHAINCGDMDTKDGYTCIVIITRASHDGHMDIMC